MYLLIKWDFRFVALSFPISLSHPDAAGWTYFSGIYFYRRHLSEIIWDGGKCYEDGGKVLCSLIESLLWWLLLWIEVIVLRVSSSGLAEIDGCLKQTTCSRLFCFTLQFGINSIFICFSNFLQSTWSLEFSSFRLLYTSI